MILFCRSVRYAKMPLMLDASARALLSVTMPSSASGDVRGMMRRGGGAAAPQRAHVIQTAGEVVQRRARCVARARCARYFILMAFAAATPVLAMFFVIDAGVIFTSPSYFHAAAVNASTSMISYDDACLHICAKSFFFYYLRFFAMLLFAACRPPARCRLECAICFRCY